ncbi:MAG: diguanylate cyclase, partial [Phormidesmis sp.]
PNPRFYNSTPEISERLFPLSRNTTSLQPPPLHQLAQHPVIYSGDFVTAAAAITQASAIALNADRVSLWLHRTHHANADSLSADSPLEQVDSYDRVRDIHVQGRVLSAADHALYFADVADRAGLSIENVAQSTSLLLNSFTARNLIFHQPGALLEIPIRYQGKVVGALWCERMVAHEWSAIERTTALSAALLASTALGSQQQQQLLGSLAAHRRQLKRESIERVQAEQAWQESQRFIQGIIDASTNILYVDNFADGRNVYISHWVKNVLGYAPEEMQTLGAHYLEQLLHPDEKKIWALGREKLAAISKGEIVENEFRFRHRQGNWRWLLCRETVFQRDEHSYPTQIFGTAIDITERKHAEMALKEFNQELERLASMDGLTQVFNRRSFDEYLKQVWRNVGSGRASLSLILCDIDCFKDFNDTYGHQAGDVCLKKVAQAIGQAVKRSTDLVARYGGEEFAVILPNTGTDGVQRVVSEIQRAIKQLAIPHRCSAVSQHITLSLGVATVSATEAMHPDMLVAAADRGLYQAKSEGRDRCCIGKVTSAVETVP